MNTNMSNKRVMKLGGYSLVITAVAIAIVIIVNLALNLLPASFVRFSMDNSGYYDISDASREIMANVDDDITVYIVVEDGYMDTMVEEYVKRYTELAPSVSYKHIDPVLRPNFIENYTDETLDSAYTNLILVNETNERSRVVKYSEIFYTQYSEMDIYYFQMYYGYTPDNPTYFNIEQCLASAVDYLTTEKLPTVYYTTGHGETALGTTTQAAVDAENIKLSELVLLTKGEVPADADVVIVNGATKDFTKEETAALKAFSERGGDVILVSSHNSKLDDRNLENLYGFASELGLSYQDTLVYEGDSGKSAAENRSVMLPIIVENAFSIGVPSGTYVYMQDAHPIVKAEKLPEGVTVSNLFTTSTKGFVKGEGNTDITKKEDGDTEGQYILGAMAEKESAKLVWISSTYITNDATIGSYSNIQYFISMLTNICEKESSVTIDAKILQVEALSIDERTANVWGAIVIAVIPFGALATGFVIWNRRTKR